MDEQQHQPGPVARAHEEQLASLLKAAAGGDARAFEAFCNATAHPLLAAIGQSHGDKFESAMVDSYLHAWRCAGEFDPTRYSALEWLLELCHHHNRERCST